MGANQSSSSTSPQRLFLSSLSEDGVVEEAVASESVIDGSSMSSAAIINNINTNSSVTEQHHNNNKDLTRILYRYKLYPSSSSSTDQQSPRLQAQDRTTMNNKANARTKNIVHTLWARQNNGYSPFRRSKSSIAQLRSLGGGGCGEHQHQKPTIFYKKIDKASSGVASDTVQLQLSIEAGNWKETCANVSRLASRLLVISTGVDNTNNNNINNGDPNLQPTTQWVAGGGGTAGFERNVFVLSSGIPLLLAIFADPGLKQQQQQHRQTIAVCSNNSISLSRFTDARTISKKFVATNLASCWNEALAMLRELVFYMPEIIEQLVAPADQQDSEEDQSSSSLVDFLPWLFTLLSHSACFDAAATLIEEIISLQSQAMAITVSTVLADNSIRNNNNNINSSVVTSSNTVLASCWASKIFCLHHVQNLYNLWNTFSVRQLAHFCRILALLVFEPEDRQFMESPTTVLKSIDMLRMRRERAAKAFLNNSSNTLVDQNQSILVMDECLMNRLVVLLKIMNYAPDLHRVGPYHIMAHFPWIAETLFVLGLTEIENWDDVDRTDTLARRLSFNNNIHHQQQQQDNNNNGYRGPSHLGSVADMFESLTATSNTFLDNNNNTGEPPQSYSDVMGQFIDVVNAAQAAGVIGGTNTPESIMLRGTTRHSSSSSTRYQQLSHPEDAANEMQFNALLLAPYQVEVLFVICTLLGGRRKVDAQNIMTRLGLGVVLDEMFDRLSWGPRNSNINAQQQRDHGIHGPGCECNPESALRVQYLRLLHNYSDRDCDNYHGRRQLLSQEECDYILLNATSSSDSTSNSAVNSGGSSKPKSGIVTKIAHAFMREPDDSPYKFWLASCIESFLRGSSPREKHFVAQTTGLLLFLLGEVTNDRFHCAGSLQTSFDLLGELCKGNTLSLDLLLKELDESAFQRLMEVSVSNLVDSNVFIRSLLITVEMRPVIVLSSSDDDNDNERNTHVTKTTTSYLTHSWWDHSMNAPCIGAPAEDQLLDTTTTNRSTIDDSCLHPSDWFPPLDILELSSMNASPNSEFSSAMIESPAEAASFIKSITDLSLGGIDRWKFHPTGHRDTNSIMNAEEAYATYYKKARLKKFLEVNQSLLLSKLLGVVDLHNINHETICCLNTAVIIAVFASRRSQLAALLQDLVLMNDTSGNAHAFASNEEVGERSGKRLLVSNNYNGVTNYHSRFRELLWFWTEYYTHRGRDRLSLEFSSKIRFHEWKSVVGLLCADDGSKTSLCRSPSIVLLPRSPYCHPPRAF